MCGIVGLYLKNKKYNKDLGKFLTGMMNNMSTRGPDSAGFAIYSTERKKKYKYSICYNDNNIKEIKKKLSKEIKDAKIKIISDHFVLETSLKPVKVISIIKSIKNLNLVGYGSSIEIFKQVGNPKDVVNNFSLKNFSGTHAIGHTRMATESAITTDGSHPYSTGEDECLVHNGSLSNHNNLRRNLTRDGIKIETENDSEIAAAYLTNKMSSGATLGKALEDSLNDLDGFFTFVVGTKQGFGVLRDPIACKPAVMAETDQYVAFGSEYRALVDLPKIATANVWEPEPATVYFWTH